MHNAKAREQSQKASMSACQIYAVSCGAVEGQDKEADKTRRQQLRDKTRSQQLQAASSCGQGGSSCKQPAVAPQAAPSRASRESVLPKGGGRGRRERKEGECSRSKSVGKS